jgi:hypothetical protein
MANTFFYLVSGFFFLFYSLSAGSYISTELFSIEWGDDEVQLKVTPVEIIPPDSGILAADYEVHAGAGPTGVFVDDDENFIFYSYDFWQLKGFNNVGDLIFNYSYGEAEVNPDIYDGKVDAIYIDSNLKMYVVNFPGRSFIPVVDYEGNILDKLYPFAPDLSVPVLSLYWKSNGDICFYSRESGYVTYSEGNFSPGGTPGFLAMNGSYYSATETSPTTIRFNRYENPDTRGIAENREITEISFPGESIYTAVLLNGGDGSHLFVLKREDTIGGDEIWELDLDYNLLDRIQLECWLEDSIWDITPFVGHGGAIYEFRCLEDGVHVIRWSKE